MNHHTQKQPSSLKQPICLKQPGCQFLSFPRSSQEREKFATTLLSATYTVPRVLSYPVFDCYDRVLIGYAPLSAGRQEDEIVRKLTIPLSSVPDDGGYALDESLSEIDLRPEHSESLGLRAISVSGTVSVVGSEYLFGGTISGTFDGHCDRCLEAAKVVCEQQVTWLFEHGKPGRRDRELAVEEVVELSAGTDDAGEVFPETEGPSSVYVFEGNEIDLGPFVWEELSFVAPSKMVCKEDCEGLCNACGANLNRKACTCKLETKRAGSAFAGLKDMFPDLPTGSPKE